MGPQTRRKNFTEDELTRMKQLESEGKTRKEIAVDLGAHPSAITRRLGAVRSYRGNRLKEEVN